MSGKDIVIVPAALVLSSHVGAERPGRWRTRFVLLAPEQHLVLLCTCACVSLRPWRCRLPSLGLPHTGLPPCGRQVYRVVALVYARGQEDASKPLAERRLLQPSELWPLDADLSADTVNPGML